MQLGHNAFARHLRISHPYWHQLRTGKRPITLTVARRVLQERPDPTPLLAADLVSADTAREVATLDTPCA